VEKKLDVSYKFFLVAIVVFAFGIFFDILEAYIPIFQKLAWNKLITALFLLFYTLGVFEMRSLIIHLEEDKSKKIAREEEKE